MFRNKHKKNRGSHTWQFCLNCYQKENSWHSWISPEGFTGIFTLVLALATVALIYYSHEESKKQLDALVNTERAWIKVDVAPIALKFDPQSGDGNIAYSIHLKNVGNSVALGIQITAQVIVIPSNKSVFNELPFRQESLCASMINNKASYYEDKAHMGIKLFPNETYPPPEAGLYAKNYGGYTILKVAEMKAGEPELHDEHTKDIFSPYLIGCVTYKLGVTAETHQTGFIYEIYKQQKSKEGSTVPMMIKMNNNLMPPDLAFEDWYFGTGKID